MTNKFYPHLFDPLTIRGKKIKNRIVSAPQSCPYMLVPGDNGFFNYSEDAALYYANIARGGAGIVNTGHLGVDPRYYLGGNKMYFNFFSPLLRWHQIPSMRRMTTMIHAHGSLASIELNHGGQFSTPLDGGAVPGPCTCVLENGKKVRGIDENEMNEIAEYFASAAEVGVKGGFDIINVHAGHNWLLGQFFSPIENKRTDKYGGSVENRARFPKMVLKRIRDRVGKDIPMEIRFSASELYEGGYGIDEAIETIQYLQDTIDIVQCSVGKIGYMESEAFTFPTQYMEHGCNAYLAAKMRKNVNIIVETIGAINEPDMAETLISNGTADLIGMARSFIADPNWARKAELGKPEDIRPCIRCVRCMDSNEQTGVGECTVNPRRIMYREFPKEMPEIAKRIAVIGGGPAGMQAAFELGNKGHKVSLFEENNKLGGRLSFADHITFKEDIKRFREYLITQVQKCENVNIKLNTLVTPDLIQKDNYDAAIIAIGALPVMPRILGIDSPKVSLAVDVYGKEKELGENVIIIGGGQIGCETAIHLYTLGKNVSVIEIQDELMKDSTALTDETFSTKYYMAHEFNIKNKSFVGLKKNMKIHIFLNSHCKEITQTGIIVKTQSGEMRIEADNVILATGFKPNESIKEQFSHVSNKVLFIGDCDKVGSLRDTSASGYYASLRL